MGVCRLTKLLFPNPVKHYHVYLSYVSVVQPFISHLVPTFQQSQEASIAGNLKGTSEVRIKMIQVFNPNQVLSYYKCNFVNFFAHYV